MKTNVYNGVCVIVRDNGNVVIVSETDVIGLPTNAGDFIADNSSYAKEITSRYETAGAEIHRQQGVIKDLEGDLAKAKEKITELENRIAKLAIPKFSYLTSDNHVVKFENGVSDGHFDIICKDDNTATECAMLLNSRQISEVEARKKYDLFEIMEDMKPKYDGAGEW